MKKLSKNILVQALDCDPTGMLIVCAQKPGFPIAYSNAAIEAWTGYEKSDLIGRMWTELLDDQGAADGNPHGDPAEDLETQIAAIRFDPLDQPQTLQQRWKTKAGQPLSIELSISPLYDRPGIPSYWLLSQFSPNNAEQGRPRQSGRVYGDTFLGTRQRMMRMNRHDSATGIPNRTAFIEVVERDWAIARREQRRLSVIIFQVDALDRYTDSFGRHATSSTLRKVAHAITGSLRRQGDFGARYSKDRFAVIMGSADEEQVTSVAEHVVRKVRSLAIHHPKSTADRFVTVSYGIASEVPSWTASSSTLVDRAEENLPAAVTVDESNKAAG